MATLGLSGLASGVDTDTIVARLIELDSSGISRNKLREKKVNAQDSSLKEIQTKLRALKSASTELRSLNTWKDTQSVESSEPARVTVERTGMAPPGGFAIEVRQLASAEQEGFTYSSSGSATQITINGVAVDVAANASSAELASTINGRGDLAVYATAIDSDTVVFTARATGGAGAFNVSGAQLAADATYTRGATNAEYSLDAGATWRTSGTNVLTDAMPGLKITLKATTTSPVTLGIGAPGVDAGLVKNKVKAFITAYNELIDSTRNKLDEKKVKDAANDVDRVKGNLFGDNGLSSMLRRLRTGVTDAVAGIDSTALDTLLELGISTGKATGGTASADAKRGKLTLDDVAFDQALLADSQKVRRLFGGVGDLSGFAQRIEGLVDSEVGTDGLIDGRLKSNSQELERIQDSTKRMEDRLTAKEKRLRAQFAAMETAMSRSQTQSEWLSGQIAGLLY